MANSLKDCILQCFYNKYIDNSRFNQPQISRSPTLNYSAVGVYYENL